MRMMACLVGTSDWPCWLAEASELLLLALLLLLLLQGSLQQWGSVILAQSPALSQPLGSYFTFSPS